MNGQKIEKQLAQLFDVMMEELKTNNQFAEKIRGIFNASEQESHQISGSRRRRKDRILSSDKADANAKAILPSASPEKRTRKRNPSLFNPETVLKERGEDVLFTSLNQLEVEQLKDIISEYGMDPARKAVRWRKKERFVDHIIEVVNNRIMKGSAFRKSR